MKAYPPLERPPNYRRWIGRLRYHIAWIRWAWQGPYRLGDPLLGKGSERAWNIVKLRLRWEAREPKREDF